MSYRKEFDEDMKSAKWYFWRIFWSVLGIGIVISIIGYGLGWFGEAAQVAKDELGPKRAAEKYTWFLQQAKYVKEADANIRIYRQKDTVITKQYERDYGTNHKTWDMLASQNYQKDVRTNRDQLSAAIAARNNLVADYNAASANFLWAPFKSKSDCPDSAFVQLSN